MSINIYPSIAKVKRNGVYENLPGFVQQSGDADIEAMIATKETASIAQYAHPQGSYFILNDVLYQADVDIPVSGTIAVGTNCHVAVLANDVVTAKNDVKDLNSSIENFGKETIFVLTDWEQGGINYSTGREETSSSVCRTIGYFTSETDITLNVTNPNNQTLGLRVYNSDGSYSGSENISNKHTLTCLGGKRYRVVNSSTGNPSNVTCTFSYYNENSFPSIKNDVSEIDSIVSATDAPTMQDGYYIAKENGVRIANTVFSCTDFIRVYEGFHIKIDHYASSGTVGCVYYKKDKTWLSYLDVEYTSDGSYFGIVPPDAVYLRITTQIDKQAELTYYDVRKYATSAYETASELAETGLPLKNTQILIFGDSITDCCNISVNSDIETTAYSFRNPSNSYVNALGETIRFSMWAKILLDSRKPLEIRNYAKTGAHYEDMSVTSGNERQNVSYQIQLALNDRLNPNGVFAVNDFKPDIVIFSLGTNDGYPNDTPSDAYAKIITDADGTININDTLTNMDRTKFCESILWAFLKVKQAFPLAQCYCVTPLESASRPTIPGNLRNYMVEIAERYNYIVIDGSYKSGITKELNVVNGLGEYLIDGLHPNEKGQNMLARLIITSLESNFCKYDEGFN